MNNPGYMKKNFKLSVFCLKLNGYKMFMGKEF